MSGVVEEGRPDLVLDELDEKLAAFQLLRKSDEAGADSVLSDLGAQDRVDRDIVLELGAKRPLGHPERFPEAHALMVRSLEVLDRNGARGVSMPGRLGPLRPIGNFLVQLVAHFIVRSYQATVIDNIRHLYARREANALVGDPERPMLTRARLQADRLAPGFKRNPLGVPTFLLGGAVLSTVVGLLQDLLNLTNSTIGRIIGTAVVFTLFGIIAWAILRGAAVARRRIILTTERPLEALYETIGRAGKPPRDQSRVFALIAIILMGVAWFIIPLGLGVAFLTGN